MSLQRYKRTIKSINQCDKNEGSYEEFERLFVVKWKVLNQVRSGKDVSVRGREGTLS